MFEVKSSDDLFRLNSHYMSLCDSGFDGALEIRVGAGPFTDIGWGLTPGDRGGPCTIDVVLRGSGAVFPFPSNIRARSVRLEDVVITGSTSASAEVHVTRGFSMLRSSIIDGRMSDPNWTRAYLEVYAEGKRKVATSVQIEDSWFVRNYQARAETPVPLLSVRTRDQSGYFGEVVVRRSAFLGNAFTTDLAVDTAASVAIEDSVFYRTWPTGTELSFTSCGRVAVTRSRFVVESVDRVAEVNVTPKVIFTDTVVIARDRKLTPTALVAIGSAKLVDRATFEPHEAEVTEAIKALTTPPLHAPPAELWKRLQPAFGA